MERERQLLLSQLSAHVDALNEEFSEREMSSGRGGAPAIKGKNLPDVVNCIVWTRQLASKLHQTKVAALNLVGDLPGVAQFARDCDDLRSRMAEYEKERFEKWLEEVEGAMKGDGEVAMQLEGRLMDIDYNAGGEMRVNYSERLVTLLREVRQLSAIGKDVPATILEKTATAEQYYHTGVILKQVANFYNNLSTEIIPCTKGLMLQQAIAFEEVVTNPEGAVADTKKGGSSSSSSSQSLTWSHPAQVDAYIARLKTATEKLTSQNRRLRKMHLSLAERVITLMNTDLLRQRQKWKDELEGIRGTIESLSSKHEVRALKPLREHWDVQLSKALEYVVVLGHACFRMPLSPPPAQTDSSPLPHRLRYHHHAPLLSPSLLSQVSVPAGPRVAQRQPGRDQSGASVCQQAAAVQADHGGAEGQVLPGGEDVR
jgi:dynein heavy chain 2